MNITNNREVMIFKNEWQDKVIYNVGLSKKKQDGTYENGSIMCQFKNGVNLLNKTKIMIKSAWLTFYKNKDNHTIPYIFINEFEEVVQALSPSDFENMSNSQVVAKVMEEDPFADFESSVSIDDNFLD